MALTSLIDVPIEIWKSRLPEHTPHGLRLSKGLESLLRHGNEAAAFICVWHASSMTMGLLDIEPWPCTPKTSIKGQSCVFIFASGLVPVSTHTTMYLYQQ